MSAARGGSSTLPSPSTTATTVASPHKQSRPLACIACQQRKLKCDRNFPCSRCLKSGVQCVPADSVPRTRKKRFAEKQLLDRLRHYETLLREAGVQHEALHEHGSGTNGSGRNPNMGTASPESSVARPSQPKQAKDIWDAMNQTNAGLEDHDGGDSAMLDAQPDVVRNAVVQDAFNEMYDSGDSVLFGIKRKDLDFAALHPPSSRIFKYWQIFLDNANSLLKIVHAPSFQARLVDALGDLSTAPPAMHALLFGIYCMAIHTLDDTVTQETFGSSKTELLNTCHFACQQALLTCGVLKTTDREVLAALFLYFISIRENVDPRTLSSMLGIAARLAQRMGLHSEAENSKCNPFEAEMRRRLWWALVIYDSRMSDMASNKGAVLLNPTWDCKTPANLEDSLLWPDMSTLPSQPTTLGDATYVTVRSSIDDFIRKSKYYLEFTNPILIPLAQSSDDLAAFEQSLLHKYVNHLTLDNPVHFITKWSAFGHLAKQQLFKYYAWQSSQSAPPTNAQRDTAVTFCMRMLQADTQVRSEPTMKRYNWLIHFNFPFPAYLHIVQDIRKRPDAPNTGRCWEVMSDNYEARFLDVEPGVGLFHRLIAKLIVQTWLDNVKRESANMTKPGIPRIVQHVARKLGVKDLSQSVDNQTRQQAPSHPPQADALPSPEAGLKITDDTDPFASLASFSDMSDCGFDLGSGDFDWHAFDMDTLFAS